MPVEASNLQLRNPWSWYPVVASKDLSPGALMPVVLNDERLVVWRTTAGKVNAWGDRCPHRGMRLSFGAVDRESLICPYHGWTFGDDARCIRIPAHPGVSPSRAARARLFPVAEVDGFVWACSGEPATATPEADSGYASVRTMHLDLPLEDAIAAFMTLPCAPALAVSPPSEVKWSTAPETANVVFARSDTMLARFEAPSSVFCETTGPDGTISYLVRLQPTEAGSCAVHTSLHGGDAVAFNRALVGFHTAINRPDIEAWLRTAVADFETTAPVHVSGLIQGEAP